MAKFCAYSGIISLISLHSAPIVTTNTSVQNYVRVRAPSESEATAHPYLVHVRNFEGHTRPADVDLTFFCYYDASTGSCSTSL